MAGWVADKSWLLIMVLQTDSENSATGISYYLKNKCSNCLFGVTFCWQNVIFDVTLKPSI